MYICGNIPSHRLLINAFDYPMIEGAFSEREDGERSISALFPLSIPR